MGTSNDPAVDVVIPVYNNFKLTERCLRCLAVQAMPHRVIVVDDGSSDETLVRLKSSWPEVTVISLESNRGYTTAVNLGVAAGTGEFVVLLNNDVELEPGALSSLLAPLVDDRQCGSVAAVMLARDGETIDSVGVTADKTLAGFARLRGFPPGEAERVAPALAGPDGNAGAYRRKAWQEVGGLDEHMTAYLEVLDLALRLAAAGWGTKVAAQARGIHLGSATFGARSRTARKLAAFSRGYTIRRWGVLHSRAAPRTILTEAIVVVADMLLSRDRVALEGRRAGWRAAERLPRHDAPPFQVVDRSITFLQSLALRRATL